jgi:hypothetical protein
MILLMKEKHILDHLGQLLPMEIDGQKQWGFYLEVQEKLDLPPDTCAVLMTPSAFEDMPLFLPPESERIAAPPWERNAYSIIISDCRSHAVIMQASLQGIESVGIDIFEEGRRHADYT